MVTGGVAVTRRCGCTTGVVSVAGGDATGLIVAVGAGTMGGVARKSMAGEGRTLGGVDGAAVVEGAAAEAEGALVAVGEGDAGNDGSMEGVTFARGVGEGRVRTVGDATGAATVAEATGVALAAAAGLAVGVALACAAGVALAATVGLTVGVALALAAGVGLAATVAVVAGVAVDREAGVGLDATGVGEAGAAAGVVLAAGVAAAAVAAGVAAVVAVSDGFTNRFEGALGGGVASALILVRARSAAERSAIAVQPLSTTTSATRSFTLRGRGISGISMMTGVETSSSLP